MKVFTNNTFHGRHPTGSAAVVRAASPEEAAKLLSDKLREIGLEQTISPLLMIPLPSGTTVAILHDGDY